MLLARAANPTTASTGRPDLTGATWPSLDFTNFLLPFGPKLPSIFPLQALPSSPLQISVAFADSSSASANFPEPWNESNALVNFVGSGTHYRAGAIRLDNPSGTALTVDSVVVDLGRPGPVFQLWTNINVPANGSAILTQTADGNFNTGASPIVGCGQPLGGNETRIPKVTVTIAGAGTDYLDTAHVLDTGGFDSSCRGNQSLQWRAIGAAGIEAPSGSIQLSGDNAPHAVGTSNTFNIQVNDAGNQPLSNVPVALQVLNGPNSGETISGTTDGTGNATVQYSSAVQGTDLLQAVVSNLSGGVAQSQQMSTTWTSSAACPAPANPNPAATQLIYVGQTTASFGNQVTLAALLTDGTGNPLSGRTLSVATASQTLAATTDTNGIASLTVSSLPVGTNSIALSFAGDQNFQASQLNSTVTVQPAATLLRYTGSSLFTSLGQQAVSAVLTDAPGRTAVANRTVNFVFNGTTVSATTDARGAAIAAFNFQTAQTTGLAQLQINFAGDADYLPATRAATVEVFQATGFVIWGGNSGGLKVGQQVNFWGAQWADQVTGGQFAANPSFKGFADTVETAGIQQCQPTATTSTLNASCWTTKPGNSSPPATLANTIQVIVATAIDKSGSSIFGNISCSALVKVSASPTYGPDPGHPGFGTITAVNGDCAGVFPQPAVVKASQQQPSPVLPSQQISVNYAISNQGGTDATNASLTENFDQLTPATGSANVGTIAAGQSTGGSFSVTIPAIGGRQSNESSVDYESRLAASDGKLFTSEGELTFTDPFSQLYSPLDFSSFSQLNLPRLTVGLSGATCIAPGSSVAYSVRVGNVGSATAQKIGATLTLPDNSISALTVPDLASGTSFAGTVNFQAPGIAPKSSSESTQSYLARLAAVDGTTLPAAVIGSTWQDQIANSYGPVQQPFTSLTERVPIVSTTVPGNQSLLPNQKTQFSFTASNKGGGNAVQVTLTLKRQDGSLFTIPNFSLPGGQSGVVTANFAAPAVAPKSSTETDAAYLARLASANGTALNLDAILNWTDSARNNYGPTDNPFTATQVLPVLQLSANVAPASLLPGQTATVNLALNNAGGADAQSVAPNITNPDGSHANPTPFTVPAGQSNTAVSTTFQVAAVAPKGPSESDAAYTTRLQGFSGAALNFGASLSWRDGVANLYGPIASSSQSREVLPIIQIVLTGPATAQAGNSISYGVTATNIGTAPAPTVPLALTLPNGTVQQLAAGPLAPGATFQTTVNFAIPITQAAGAISAALSTSWNDAAPNAYGPVSSTAATAVTPLNTLTLAPAIVGPNVTGASQRMTATVQGPRGTPASGVTVQFTVTGANSASGSAVTDSTGTAIFSYVGANSGTDTVVASSGGVASNTATVNWIVPAHNVSTSTVFGRFFSSDDSCLFDTPTTTPPLFTQEFPTINFNAPFGTIPGNTSRVGEFTRPFTDVTTDLNGNFTGTIVAQGNGFQAGVGPLFSFNAVFTGTLTIAKPGNVTLSFFSDDGFIFGVGGGATRVNGPLINVPPSGATPFENLSVIASFNRPSSPAGNTIVAQFPAAGTYPYEVDYTECRGGELALTIGVGSTNSQGVPPSGSLALSPLNPAPQTAGQTQTFNVQASDVSGAPVANLGVALIVSGANPQQLSATTDSLGRATLSYSGANAGNDSIQATANISGLGTFSNLVNVSWTVPAGGGTGGGGNTVRTVVPQGWIGQPAIGTVVQGQLPITVAPGIALTSGVLEFWPTSNPANITVLNSNTTGSGTIGAFDGTLLANGGYTIQLQATASNGTSQTSLTTVSVMGENKPGRVTATVTDLQVPLGGFPITIARTYDSLERSRVEDFGFGWSLSVGVKLEVDAANNVTFTLNGRRQTFFFQPQPSSFLFPWLLTPNYTPQSGLHGTLTSDGCGGLVQVQGGVTCFLTGAYQPTTFAYTDPTGRVYTIARNGQLKTIKDLNGNILTLTPTGISSSVGGVTVPFVRDAQGRITQITDLNGNNYNYSYDSAGNLASLALPGVNTPVSSTYSADHLLLRDTDPRGNSSQATYFPDGRLQSVTDPLGNTTQFSYNMATNTTTTTNPDGGVVVQTNNSFGKPLSITDALNRTTTFTYDPNQNLLTQTDALGKTTSFTYDANGFQTSVKDPLGNTTTRVFNRFGRVTSATDALGNASSVSNDDSFNPTQLSDSLGQLATGTFDGVGNVLSVTNANGKTTQFSYDARGNQISKTDPLNQTTSSTYDSMSLLVSQTDPRGNTTKYAYDALGNRVSQTDATNHVTRSTYDNNGNKTADIDALGRTTSFSYDTLNRLIKVTYPDNTTRQYTYDFRGNKLSEIDQLGRTTRYTYDKAGQLVSLTKATGTSDAGTLQYSYDAVGRRTTSTDERGNVTTYSYDDAGRATTIKNALGNITAYGYDADGRRISVTDAKGNVTRSIFDARGELTTVIYPDTTATKYTYDGVGNQLTVTDQAGQLTTRAYDGLRRLTSVTDALGHVTQYSYDPTNNLTRITDAAGHATSFQYDSLNRRVLRTLPLGMSESSTYDAVGNLTAKTDFNSKTTTYSYDALNRLLQKTPDSSFKAPPVIFSYTATGDRASMQDASGTTLYTYDNRDRLINEATPEGTLRYTYDVAGNLLTLASSNTNGASVSYSYDILNRLSDIIDNRLLAQGAGSAVTTYNYDTVGNLTNYPYPNSVQTSYIYNSVNRIIQTGSSSSRGGVLSNFSYALGATGNRLSVTEQSGRSVNYGYDAIFRLTSEAIASDPAGKNGTVSYAYDAVGNRTQLTSTLAAIPSGGPFVFGYDANDRLNADTYDANGNTIFSAGIPNAYDFENHLIQHGAVTIVYDGDGNRVAEIVAGVTTKYLVDVMNPTGYAQVVDELQNGSVVRTYTYGLQRISENQLINNVFAPSFYGYDAHGSVRFLTNASGSVTDTYDYDAFGSLVNSTGSTPNNYLFAGEQFDPALGFYYMRARYYNPLSGRFATIDPELGDPINPKTFQKYIYADADPINNTDPTGRLSAGGYIAIAAILAVLITLTFLGAEIGVLLCKALEPLIGPTIFSSVCRKL
jgi:RHS repeat-associated protein/uncharacterized repeat protein (TIGR01451 family)